MAAPPDSGKRCLLAGWPGTTDGGSFFFLVTIGFLVSLGQCDGGGGRDTQFQQSGGRIFLQR